MGRRGLFAAHGTRTTAPRGRRPPAPCTGMAGRAFAPTAPYLCGKQGGSALSQLPLWRLLSAPDHASGRPGASPSLGQSPVWAALVGHIGLVFHIARVPAGGPRVQRVAGQEDEVSSGGGGCHVQGHGVAQRGRGGPGWSKPVAALATTLRRRRGPLAHPRHCPTLYPPSECRAAQSRQAHSDEACMQPSWGWQGRHFGHAGGAARGRPC